MSTRRELPPPELGSSWRPPAGGAVAMGLITLLAGGAPAQDAPSRILRLRQGWRLQSTERVRATGEMVSSPGFATPGWYTTSIPSTVLAAQVAAGDFPDPFFGKNLRSIPGTTYPEGFNSFSNLPMDEESPYARPWWYRTEFMAPPELLGRHLALHLDGVNQRADVWINGTKVATREDVAGAYRLHEMDVTSVVRPGEPNVLALEVTAPTEKDLSINWVDWNPTPPDKNMGLWGEVYLSVSGPVVVRHPFVATRLDEAGVAHLTVDAELANVTDHPVEGIFEARLLDTRLTIPVRLEAGETRSVRLLPEEHQGLRVKNPELWWPAEMGDPRLHEMQTSFAIGGDLSDTERIRFGIREVTSEITAAGHRLFRINGKPILIRGAEWAMDMLLRPKAPERLEAELAYVLEMHLNTLRLEGQLQDDAFLERTDELGILVMAGFCCCDMWEKWPEWPAGNLRVATESLRTQALRMRRHPSLLAWLNASDGPPPPDVERAYLEVLADLSWPNPVLSSASAIPTPVSGPTGVKMTGPYDYEPPSYWLTANVRPEDGEASLTNARFGGAFGFNTETGPGAAIPPLESLRKFLPEEGLWPIDATWRFHCAGERFQNLDRFTEAMSRTYGAPRDLADFLRKAEAMAYDGTRAMFEAHGRNKYEATGVIHWTLNNAWPSLYWHLYDSFLYPAGGYFGARKAGEPLHVQYSYDDRSVVVVSTRRQDVAGLTVRAQVYDLSLDRLFEKEASVLALADSASRVFLLPEPSASSSIQFVRLELRDAAGQLLSSNFYWLPLALSSLDWKATRDTAFAPIATFEDLTALERLPVAKVTATARRLGGLVHVIVTNPGPGLAFQVHVGIRRAGSEGEILPVFWQDNFVSLLPGESRELTARYPDSSILDAPLALVVDGWNTPELSVAVE